MARGRLICRTLSTSEKFAALYKEAGKLAEFCQSLYPLIVSHTDDFGRLQGDPFTVKHLVHPTSPRTIEEFSKALWALHQVGLIVWYESDRRKFLSITEFEKHQPGLHKRSKSNIPEPPGNSGNFPEIPSEEKGREGKRTEQKGRESTTPTASDLLALWNDAVEHLPHAREMSPDRERHAKARLSECADLSQWAEVFRRMDASPFCQGITGRKGWRADFDFAIKPGTFGKVLEGKYDDRRAPEVTTETEAWWEECIRLHGKTEDGGPKCVNPQWHQVQMAKQGAA